MKRNIKISITARQNSFIPAMESFLIEHDLIQEFRTSLGLHDKYTSYRVDAEFTDKVVALFNEHEMEQYCILGVTTK